ncbi:MAG: inositol monophosphatase family protein [Dermatophilaceae bacterium]
MAAAAPVDDLDHAGLVDIARLAAERAGRLIVDERPTALTVAAKSTRTDPVTEMDRRSQQLIVDLLREMRPSDGVLGEEGAGVTGTSGVTWVLDPIDGTVNYLYGYPGYAVSVAAVVGDPAIEGAWTSVAGAVHDPVAGETFYAHLGGGSRLATATGTTRVHASACTDLGLALIATGFGYAAAVREQQARSLVEVIGRVRDIRRTGSAALDLCAVAAHRVDGYYESGLNIWDRAAAQLIVREAGGVVGGAVDDTPGRSLTWAAAPGIAPSLSAVVRQATARHGSDDG